MQAARSRWIRRRIGMLRPRVRVYHWRSRRCGAVSEKVYQQERDKDKHKCAIDEHFFRNLRAVYGLHDTDTLRGRNEIEVKRRIEEERERDQRRAGREDIQYQF